MANNDDKQQIDDNVKDADVVDNAQTRNTSQLLWGAIIILLVLLIASIGWFYWQLTQQQQAELAARAKVQGQFAELDNRAGLHGQQLERLQTQQQTQSDKLQQLLDREAMSSDDLMRTWRLQEIHYLLNIANQRALLAHDVAGARKALEMADEQIQMMSDYRLHPLRALIAEEVMALDALADLDKDGMALKLQAAAKRVQSLRVKKGPEVDNDNPAEATSPASDSNWKQALGDIWQQLRSLVVIRHDQSGQAAVLVPEQRYFLYQNLRLQLESARLALLNANNASYQHSLQTAMNWLEQYFIGDERDAMLSTLESLKQQDIDIAIPDISESLSWLEEHQQ